MPTSAQGSAYAQGYVGAQLTNNSAIMIPHKGYAEFSTPVLDPSDKTVDLIRDTLIKAGWTRTGTIQATASLSGPFGWGYTSFLRTVALIGDGEHGVAYQYYDPRVEPPPSGWYNGIVGGFIIQPVIAGTSDLTSQLNLVGAINGSGDFVATYQDPHTIALTAIPIGTLGDGLVVEGNGAISLGSVSTGGGWTLVSTSQDAIMGSGNTTTAQISVSTGAPGNGNVMFSLDVNSFNFNFYFGSYSWRMMADDLQICLMNTGGIAGEDIYHSNGFFWFCMPVTDTTDIPHFNSSAFIATGLGFSTSIGNSNAENDVYSWVDGTFTHAGQGTNWSMVTWHSESGSITDSADQPFNVPALLAMKNSSAIRWLGFIGNCFLSTEPADYIGEQIQENGLIYRCICTQTNPPGAIWMNTAEVAAATPGGGTTPNPGGVVGTGNVTNDATLYPGLSVLTRTAGNIFLIGYVRPTLQNPLVITNIPPGVPVLSGQRYGILGLVNENTVVFAPQVLPMSNIDWVITTS